MSEPLSEAPRPPTNDERLLARECAAKAQRVASFLCEVAANEAQVSDLLIERMWEFSAFPVATQDMIRELSKK